MQVSLKWLNNYIDLSDVDVKTVAETLTNLGLEVEGIEKVEPLKGDVIVAKIVSAERHPDAEKLQFVKSMRVKLSLSISCAVHLMLEPV